MWINLPAGPHRGGPWFSHSPHCFMLGLKPRSIHRIFSLTPFQGTHGERGCFPCPNSEAFSRLIKILAWDQELLEPLGSKRPGIVFHCSGTVVQTLCEQKQTGGAFGCFRAWLLGAMRQDPAKI